MTSIEEMLITANRAATDAQHVAEQSAELLRRADLDAQNAAMVLIVSHNEAAAAAFYAAQNRAIRARVAFELAKVSAKRLQELEHEIGIESLPILQLA